MDNGFASFDHVKIPRRNMAMRFSEVNEHGKYRKKSTNSAASKVAYITMMQVRAHICNEAGKNLGKACTIVTRYSAVRRQGFTENGQSEFQVLDYKQQQHRILPLLACSYCFFFTGKKVLEKLKAIEYRLMEDKPVTKAEVTDIHASSSGLKSFTTMIAADGMEDCRKACGGHGFLACSGLPELVTTYLQSPTVEGDNHMLPQQVVKVLLKLVQAIYADEDLSDYIPCDSYHLVPSLKTMIQTGEKESFSVAAAAQVLDLDALIKAFRHRAARLLVECAAQLQSSAVGGKSAQEAWNDGLVQMARVSRAYSQFLLLVNFVNGIQDSKKVLGGPDVSVLLDLARLFGLYWMERELGDFLEDGYLSAKHAKWVRAGVLTMLDTVRPNAVPLVDAFDFSDFVLRSALGRYDGNVYPAIMEAAKRDPLNKNEVGPGYEEHLKRLIVDGVGVYTGTAARL
jgi:acyl-CoA oxidase